MATNKWGLAYGNLAVTMDGAIFECCDENGKEGRNQDDKLATQQ